jgi:primosomal protein N' (replication factor Y) (superfamily II helicase)
LLPQARVARLDRDSSQRRDAGRDRLAAVHEGDIDVLVGTQMIAKGHDFRRVTLVGVLNADAALASHDFRAPERLFATLLQVAGRAGRAGQPSRVLVQTRYPQHPLYRALATGDYEGFARSQLAERVAAGMPPASFQALLGCQARTLERALDWLSAARSLAAPAAGAAITLYDPVPMPLTRLAGIWRAQLLVESRNRAALQAFVRTWLAEVRARTRELPGGVRWHIEVDPQVV